MPTKRREKTSSKEAKVKDYSDDPYTTKDKAFYCNIYNGFLIKGIIDFLCQKLSSRVKFRYLSTGLSLRQMDEHKHVCYDIDLSNECFKLYHYKGEKKDETGEGAFSVNIKHVQKLVKNVKKKEGIIIFIPKGHKKLGISIYPQTNPNTVSKIEASFFSIQKEEIYQPDDVGVPEFYELNGQRYPVYGNPMVVHAPDFQKIKKITNLGKRITVNINGISNMIIRGAEGDIYSSTLEFNNEKKIDDSDDESDDSSSSISTFDGETVDELTASEDDGENTDDDIEDGDDDEEDDEEEDEEEDEDDESRHYVSDFDSKTFSILTKLPPISKQIQFYPPICGTSYPLFVKANVGDNGSAKVYIKNEKQVAYEESLKKGEKKGIRS